MRKLLDLLLLSAQCLFLTCCGHSSNVVDVDDVETVELDRINSDIRIKPIKCSCPMDAIYRGIGYDDYIFLSGYSRKNIYCIREDTVVAVLDASGRGHGEYSYIDDFAYSQEEHILYLSADGKLFKYSVPNMEYLGSVDLSVTTSTMIVLGPEEILMNCSFYEDNGKDVYRGICIVSPQTGEVLERLYELDYINKKRLLNRDLTAVPGGFVLPLNSFAQNSILFYDSANGSVQQLFTFSFTKKWRTPKRLVRLAGKDLMLYIMEDNKETRHLEGVHYPFVNDSGLSFWCFPRENDNARTVAVTVKDNRPVCRSYKISGTEIDPSPFFIHNGYWVDIIASTEFDGSNEKELSPLGLELKRAVDAQAFDNPVLLYFKAD